MPELPHKVAGTERADGSGISNMKLFGILCGKPLQNGFQPTGVGGFCWELLFSLCKKQRQKTQQCSFDDKLIAGELGTVGIFYFPQACSVPGAKMKISS